MLGWLADECVSAALVERLRDENYDVVYVAEHNPGASDRALIERALQEQRLLLTEDKDFGELAFRQGRAASGVVLLRLPPGHSAFAWARLEAAIVRYGEQLFGRYTVVEASRIRSRPLGRP